MSLESQSPHGFSTLVGAVTVLSVFYIMYTSIEILYTLTTNTIIYLLANILQFKLFAYLCKWFEVFFVEEMRIGWRIWSNVVLSRVCMKLL